MLFSFVKYPYIAFEAFTFLYYDDSINSYSYEFESRVLDYLFIHNHNTLESTVNNIENSKIMRISRIIIYKDYKQQ